jgi:hypothetical protein
MTSQDMDTKNSWFGQMQKLFFVFCYLAKMALGFFGSPIKKKRSRFFFTKTYLEALALHSRIETQNTLALFPELGECSVVLYGLCQTELVRDYSSRVALVSTLESLILGGLTQLLQPKTIFEFGTFAGGSTYQLFLNSDDATRIHTLDLNSTAQDNVQIAQMFDSERVTRHLGNSLQFNFESFFGKTDLIFIDGGHDYETVQIDTQNALRMRSARSVVVWHDYKPDHPGVFRTINQLASKFHLIHLEGTSLVVLKSWK